jgi:gamma-glutamyltranspeptidase/glutathione hydrolase
MGGDMQPQGQVQVLVNTIDFAMNIQAAGDAARIQHYGSATPTGKPATGVGEIHAEPGIPQSVVDSLQSRGHVVTRTEKNPGGYQGILIDHENGTLLGASESRRTAEPSATDALQSAQGTAQKIICPSAPSTLHPWLK